jgi:hypothetical protein
LYITALPDGFFSAATRLGIPGEMKKGQGLLYEYRNSGLLQGKTKREKKNVKK